MQLETELKNAVMTMQTYAKPSGSKPTAADSQRLKQLHEENKQLKTTLAESEQQRIKLTEENMHLPTLREQLLQNDAKIQKQKSRIDKLKDKLKSSPPTNMPIGKRKELSQPGTASNSTAETDTIPPPPPGSPLRKQPRPDSAEPRVCSISPSKVMEVTANLDGQLIRSLWDTGCSITYCDRKALTADQQRRIEEPRTRIAKTANGSRIAFDGSIRLPIVLQSSKIYHTIHTTDGSNCPSPFIIGTDLQIKLTLSGRITTDYNKRCLELDNGDQLDMVNAISCFNAMLEEAEQRKAAEPLIARVAVETKLPPRTDNLAKGIIIRGADPNKTYVVEQKPHRFTMKVGKVLVRPDADGTIPLRLLNMGNNTITIPKGATVAYVTEATVIEHKRKSQKADDSDFDATDQELADILEQPTEDWIEQVEKLDLSKSVLNHQERKLLRRMLLRKSKAFLHKGRRLGRYTGSVRHRIRLIEGTKPIARRAHRTPLALQDAMLKELQKLIDQGLIRPSDSPFAAPTLLVRKKDGSFRFVVDYRAINQHIAPQQYVLANIQTLVDICGGRKIFSTMDYSQAYHQIPVAEEDIPLTAFITEFGLFEWTVCPYGMVNSGETFSKVMKELARQMTFRILCFVDDVIVASDSVDRHLQDLEGFLTVVENNNLTLNLAKCIFCRGEINYLGLVISHEGTRPDPSKIKAILDTARPANMTAMRRFLGMVNYLRRHIRNCAQILRPLNDI